MYKLYPESVGDLRMARYYSTCYATEIIKQKQQIFSQFLILGILNTTLFKFRKF